MAPTTERTAFTNDTGDIGHLPEERVAAIWRECTLPLSSGGRAVTVPATELGRDAFARVHWHNMILS
jgi:hypothetical protein